MSFLENAHSFAEIALDLFKKGEYIKADSYWSLAKEQLSFHFEEVSNHD